MGEKKRILIVDDEDDFCFFAKRNLELTGEFEVITSTKSDEAFSLAESQMPDLILLDIAMPKKTGPEVADELLRNARTRQIPFIFLTAVVTEKEIGVESVKEIGGHNFISKPVDSEKLIQCIRLVLEEKPLV